MLLQSFQKKLLIIIVGNKALVIGMIFILAFLFKATLYFETDILEVNCGTHTVYPIWIGDHDGTIFDWAAIRFWVRKICTLILPFIVLVFCNAHIVLHLKRKRRKSQKLHKHQPQTVVLPVQYKTDRSSLRKPASRTASQSDSKKSFRSRGSVLMKQRYSEKKGVRVATRTLVMVVGCYLISNSVSTIINIWEYFEPTFFRYQHYYAYLVASDMAALVSSFYLKNKNFKTFYPLYYFS